MTNDNDLLKIGALACAAIWLLLASFAFNTSEAQEKCEARHSAETCRHILR